MSAQPSTTEASSADSSTSKPKPNLADYGLPPDGWEHSNHHFHYGWPVTNKILRSAFLKLPFDLRNSKPSPGILCHRLELVLKFKGLNAVLCKPDEFCETRERAFTSRDDNKRYVKFISIGCTCSRKYFWRRPDPETMGKLIKIFAEEPRWMENAMTKEEFRSGMLAI